MFFEHAAEFLKLYGGTFVLFIFLAVNMAGICVVLWDKRRSRLPRGSVRRVPEKCFVRIAAFGGGIGVLMAMLLVRHKTRSHNLLLGKIAFFTFLWIVIWVLCLSWGALQQASGRVF